MNFLSPHFPTLAQRARTVRARLDQLPGPPDSPAGLEALGDILERCVASARQTKPTVKLVKRHLDALRDGVTVLETYDAELTSEAIRAVNDADRVLRNQARQLADFGVEGSNLSVATTALSAHLGRAQPWREIAALDGDIEELRTAYKSERGGLLKWQAQQAATARAELKTRDGFATLTADQAHRVLRPLAEALTDTSVEAIAPALVALKEPFLPRLAGALEECNERLDALLSEPDEPGEPAVLIVRVDVSSGLRNRVLKSEADVEAVLQGLRERLEPLVRDGKRVRLV